MLLNYHEELMKKSILVSLIIIIVISLGLKLYTVDFSIPVNSDNLGYVLRFIAHSNGDFSQVPHKGTGWSLFISPFFYIMKSNNFIDYSTLVRILSIIIATISIILVYLLGRKFFEEKYAIVAASLFAFEPHLNYNAGFGLSEPIYNLVILASFYFILNNNTKYIIPSLALSAIAWWIRINGFHLFVIISLIYFIIERKNSNLFKNYGLGIVVFLIIISPMLIQRYNQFGDPFYFWFNERIFTGSYEALVSSNIENQSIFNYVEKHGFISFIQNFVFTGILNLGTQLSALLFPYLFILLPFGILFSFRAFDQNIKFIKSNWTFILISLGFMVITFSIIPERRFLLFLFPFFIIFATIPIQRIIEYGLSTFQFSNFQKNIFLIITVSVILFLSVLFTVFQYGKIDVTLENEKIEFAKFVATNLQGKILNDSGPALEYLSYVLIDDASQSFKNYKITQNESQQSVQENKLSRIYIYAQSIDELISKGKHYELKYIISYEEKGYFHQYVDEIYYNEVQYPYLKKIFDSDEQGFTKTKDKSI